MEGVEIIFLTENTMSESVYYQGNLSIMRFLIDYADNILGAKGLIQVTHNLGGWYRSDSRLHRWFFPGSLVIQESHFRFNIGFCAIRKLNLGVLQCYYIGYGSG